MQTVQALPFAIVLLASAACSEAEATEMSADNPINCVIAFEAYSTFAAMQGDTRLARGFRGRAELYAERVRKLPEAERSDAVINDLSKRYMALKDGGLALSTECMKRQDSERASEAE